MLTFCTIALADSPVMIHLQDTPLANAAMVSSVRLDGTAFWALEDHFTFAESHHLNVLLGGIALRHSTWIGEH